MVQPNGTSWDKFEYVGQVGQEEGGLQILVRQVGQGEGGLQIFVVMMIVFITIKSSLVPLIEGLCAQI